MLRRFSSKRGSAEAFALTVATTTTTRQQQKQHYRYQDFEMSKRSSIPWDYPPEAPNTSYFSSKQLSNHLGFGIGKEEIWVANREERRYETTFQNLRRLLYACMFYLCVFPLVMPSALVEVVMGQVDKQAYLVEKFPYDGLYLEKGGDVLDRDWQRHLRSKASL